VGGASIWGLANMPPDLPPWVHWIAGMVLAGAAALWGVYQDKPTKGDGP
jgi:hypothetical protein